MLWTNPVPGVASINRQDQNQMVAILVLKQNIFLDSVITFFLLVIVVFRLLLK
jgi:hypothetical protein